MKAVRVALSDTLLKPVPEDQLAGLYPPIT